MGNAIDGDGSLDSMGVGGFPQIVLFEEIFEWMVSGHDLILKSDQALQQSLGARGTAGNVDVHRDDLIHALKDRIAAKHTAGTGTGATGNAPFGFWHLIPNAAHQHRHLVSDGATDEHEIRLAGSVAVYFSPETGNVIAGAGSRHVFNGTAGCTHRHGPEGIFVYPIDSSFYRCVEETAIRIGIAHIILLNLLKFFGSHNGVERVYTAPPGSSIPDSLPDRKSKFKLAAHCL